MGDDPMFAATRVEFVGQVLFAVVAKTRDQARRAVRLGSFNLAPCSQGEPCPFMYRTVMRCIAAPDLEESATRCAIALVCGHAVDEAWEKAEAEMIVVN